MTERFRPPLSTDLGQEIRGLRQRACKDHLARETFQTSRLLDFCSERELTKQIGHGIDQWPLVVLKELTDNALDAAEEFAPRR
jgi:hypothetical protein